MAVLAIAAVAGLFIAAKAIQNPEGRKTLVIMGVIVVGLLVLASAGAGTWAHD